MEETTNSSCECWFLDVGQGTSNVILLGDKRAIVVDCGPKSSTETLNLLNRYVEKIEVLVISHNDSDHDGNIQRILNQYRKAVNAIYFLRDRKPSDIKTFGLLRTPEFKCDFPEPKRLDVHSSIFSEKDLDLSVLYPSIMDNLANEDQPNATSGVLRLKCGNRKIVYSGDATITAWMSLSEKYGQPLVCDIMTIPHHGGNIANKKEYESQKLLYSKIIRPQYGVISVGTSNQHNHPQLDTLRALREERVGVLCTQMTEKCSCDLESIRQVVRQLPQPSRSKQIEDKTSGGNSRNVACYGSVVVEIVHGKMKITNLSSFGKAFQQYSQMVSFSPICRA